jgi:hypothetical protein
MALLRVQRQLQRRRRATIFNVRAGHPLANACV